MFLRKALKALLVFVALGGVFLTNNTPAYAGFDASDCSSQQITVEKIEFEESYPQGYGRIAIRASNLTRGSEYFLKIFRDNSGGLMPIAASQNNVTYQGDPITLVLEIPSTIWDTAEGAHVRIMKDNDWWFNDAECEVGTVTVTRPVEISCEISVTQERDGKRCDILASDNNCVEKSGNLRVAVKINPPPGQSKSGRNVNVDIAQDRLCFYKCYSSAYTDTNGVATVDFTPDYFQSDSGSYRIRASIDTVGGDFLRCADVNYTLVRDQCEDSEGTRVCEEDEGLQPIEDGDNPTGATTYEICNQITNEASKAKCLACAGGSAGREGVWTAVGCIKREPEAIITRLIQIGLGMGGGVSLIMTLAGGFILSTSQGDPQKTNQAKEMITSAIIGLLFVIFSVVILQFIGVTILAIPGFGAVESS